MRKILAILVLSISALAQTGQVNHGGTGLNTAAANSILVGTGPNTYTLVAVPDCPDASGNHLNYSAGTYTITCGTSSTAGSGTPYQVTRYDSTGHALQDSTGSDNPANGPTRWTNGLSVEGNAGYRLFSNSPTGTAINLLACADPSVTTVTQVTTCPASSNKTFGIVDTGAGVSGNARVAMIGFHACAFDNQTAVNDFAAPSATNPGQCSDVGGSKPNNVQIIGKVTTVNSGAGTLATVDLFTGDTVAPGSSGGSGTVSSSCAGVAYYPSSGTTIVGDCLFITDGVGHVTMYSLGLLDSTYAGFLYMKQGPLPPAAPDNTIEEFAPTSVTTYSIQKASVPGTVGQYPQVTGTATDANGHTIDQMGWGSGGGGGGGVSNFTAGTLSPLFTTGVANPTTTPALTFSLSNAAANTIFGNFTGSSGAPSYNAISACGDSTHALSYVASSGFSCQLISGGVSSVGLSINGGSSSGIFAATGTPVTSTGTLNYNLSGTSGGVPYFSSSSILSSSAALTANNPVLGGGAGSSPISGTRSGNTTEFGTVSGSVTSTHAAVWDASGNLVDGGTPATQAGNCNSGAAMCYYPLNDSGGTTVNKIAKWSADAINDGKIATVSTGDGSAGVAVAFAGVVVSGAGTTGSATVAYGGTASCLFDATAPTKGHSVEISSTVAGACHDVGFGPSNENPESHFIFAVVEASAGASAVTTIDILPISPGFGNATIWGSPPYMNLLAATSYGGVEAMPSMLQQTDSTNKTTTDLFVGSKGLNGFRFGDPSNGANYTKLRQCGSLNTCGASGHDFLIDPQTAGFGINNEEVVRFQGNYYSVPLDKGTTSGTITLFPTEGEEQTIVLNGNTTFAITGTAQYKNPGQKNIIHVCQDGTGGRTLTWPTTMVGHGIMPAAANACLTQEFTYNDSGASGFPANGPAIATPVVATSQVAAITTTTLASVTANSTYRVTATLNCDSASAAATVNVTIGWTDPSNTAQTSTLGSAVVCTALGSSSVGNLTVSFRAKSGTNITYATAIVNTPTYDVVISNPETISIN